MYRTCSIVRSPILHNIIVTRNKNIIIKPSPYYLLLYMYIDSSRDGSYTRGGGRTCRSNSLPFTLRSYRLVYMCRLGVASVFGLSMTIRIVETAVERVATPGRRPRSRAVCTPEYTSSPWCICYILHCMILALP